MPLCHLVLLKNKIIISNLMKNVSLTVLLMYYFVRFDIVFDESEQDAVNHAYEFNRTHACKNVISFILIAYIYIFEVSICIKYQKHYYVK